MGEAVAIAAGVHAQVARHGAAGHVLARLAELAFRHIQPFQPVGVVQREADLDQLVTHEDAADAAFHPSGGKAADRGIQVGALSEGASVYLHIVQQAQTHTRAVHGLDVLVDDGLDEPGLLAAPVKCVEVVRGCLGFLHHLAGLVILTGSFHGTAVLVDAALCLRFCWWCLCLGRILFGRRGHFLLSAQPGFGKGFLQFREGFFFPFLGVGSFRRHTLFLFEFSEQGDVVIGVFRFIFFLVFIGFVPFNIVHGGIVLYPAP